jgi:hypothetical protein
MKISLLHATARVNEAIECVNLWRDRSSKENEIEHILGFDYDFPTASRAEILIKTNAVSSTKVSTRKSCVDAWNNCADDSTGDILVQMSDDMEPSSNWDKQLVSLMNPTEMQVLGFEPDNVYGSQGGLLTMAIMTRKYFEYNGYFLFPLYMSVFSDNDITQTAMLDDVLINAYGSFRVKHHHDPKKADEVLMRQNGSELATQGLLVFQMRKKATFPRVILSNSTPAIMTEMQAIHMLILHKHTNHERSMSNYVGLKKKYSQYNGGNMRLEW